MTIIAVSGLLREARIAAGPGIVALAGGNNALLLRHRLERAITGGAAGLISIGIAGGLVPSLTSGDCVVASEVVEGNERFAADPAWTARILACLPGAVRAPLAGVDWIVSGSLQKAALFGTTGGHAVDMESHIVARAALTHRLPFAVMRTIADTADSTLPPLAAVAVTAEGRVNYAAVLRSLIREPGQLPALLRTARESRKAFEALLRCRRRLGLGLLGPDSGELALDMA